MAIGGTLGSLFGGPLGAILGAVFGDRVEKVIGRGRAANARFGYAGMPQSKRAMIFCASAAAMLAKMAKADGHVTAEEIASVERAFDRLGFSRSARAHAIGAFRKAKDDSFSIYDYAREFASAVTSAEVREFLYGILWEIAAADGSIGANELVILQRMPRALGIRPELYSYCYGRYTAGVPDSASLSLDSAYQLLGLSANDDTETVRRRYRELAKKNHPDALRAQGLPEEMIGKATERMSRINSAWAVIRAARGI